MPAPPMLALPCEVKSGDIKASFKDGVLEVRMPKTDEAKKQATQTHKKNGRRALEGAYRALGPRPEGPVEPGIVIRQGTTCQSQGLDVPVVDSIFV